MPKKPEPTEPDQRSPEETSALARKVMARMLASPPVPHDKLNGHRKSKRRKKKLA
jgi:hypothetical protein